jgi:uncharacterized membrane protein YhaH (DUF805 family)
MRVWPPLLWPVMSFASLLILMGLAPWDPVALTIGIGLAVAVFAAALYIATRRLRDRPRPSGFGWVIAAVTAFYAVATVVAATLGPAYAIAAMLAGLIPLSAILILFATARLKSAEQAGRPRDASAADHRDPWPGLGVGDTDDRELSTPSAGPATGAGGTPRRDRRGPAR